MSRECLRTIKGSVEYQISVSAQLWRSDNVDIRHLKLSWFCRLIALVPWRFLIVLAQHLQIKGFIVSLTCIGISRCSLVFTGSFRISTSQVIMSSSHGWKQYTTRLTEQEKEEALDLTVIASISRDLMPYILYTYATYSSTRDPCIPMGYRESF